MSRLAVFCAVLSVCGATQAQVHKWVDENGVTQYGDRPPAAKRAQTLTIRDSLSPQSDSVPKRDWVQVHDSVIRTLWVDKANVDSGSAKNVGTPIRYVWTIENFKNSENRAVRSIRSRQHYDCDVKTSNTWEIALFSGPMATGKLLREEKAKAVVGFDQPRSKEESEIYAAICALPITKR
jgi:hypothetical protein